MAAINTGLHMVLTGLLHHLSGAEHEHGAQVKCKRRDGNIRSGSGAVIRYIRLCDNMKELGRKVVRWEGGTVTWCRSVMQSMRMITNNL